MKVFQRFLLLALLLSLTAVQIPFGPPPAAARAEEALAPLPVDDSVCPAPDPAAYLADGKGYQDASLSVAIEETRAYDTAILIARVKIRDASQLRTAMAAKFGSSRDMPGAKLAKRYNAVFAINGDYFNFDSKGYVVRQGTLYRDNPREGGDVLLIDDVGDLHIVQGATSESLAAFPGKVVNSFSFGPALVMDGQAVTISKNLQIASGKPTQRMVIGQDGPLSYVCVATEGPENPGSVGLTLSQAAELMQSLGCRIAYNLDGGSSSTMVLGDTKINALSTHKVRSICDILYFATLVTPQ